MNERPDSDDLLSRKELAAFVGVSTRTVDRWIAEGTGPPSLLLPGGGRRWRKGSVRRWIAELEKRK